MGLQGIGTPRSIADTTEYDARMIRRDADAACEWGSWTFYRCVRRLGIVRAGVGGIEGGWLYHEPGTLDLDWQEITTVAIRLGGLAAVTNMREGTRP